MGERLALRRLRATSLIRASASAVPAAGPRGLLAPGTAPAIPAAPKLAPPPVQDAGLDDSLEMAVGTPTPPRRRRHGAGEQRAAPTLASPWNARRERRRLEKEVEADEDAAARKARRTKSARALAPKVAVVVADKVAAAEKGEDTSLALVPARPDATHSKHISIRSIRL
jgi:hypothetical protein